MMSDLHQKFYLDAHQLSGLSACKLQASDGNSIDLNSPGQEVVSASVSPPLSPRSVGSTPGQTSDTFPPIFRHVAPSRQCSRDRQRFSHDVPYSHSLGRNYSQAASSTYSSSSSSCSIVRAIAGLGLEGPCAGGSNSLLSCSSFSRRGSISKAKKILAEAINSVPGAHGMASCTSLAADTGVLSPLLSIIRSNGVSRASVDSSLSSRNSTSVVRRSSFVEAGWGASSLYSLGDSRSQRVQKRSSFSEAAGGLECEDTVVDDDSTADATISSSLGTWHCSSSSMSQVPSLSGNMLLSPAQQQQKVVDCLETVRYLAMDDSNRVALVDLGAVELLLSKLQNGAKSTPTTTPAVVEASLAALTVLCKHDTTRLRVWESAHSTALLQLLSSRRTSPEVKAAHLCVAHLAWSFDHDRQRGSSVFDSVSSHPYRDDATSTTSSSCSSSVLLAPALVSAVAAGLHPSAQMPVLLSLLKLLDKAASSSCLAPLPVPVCCGSSCLSESSGDQLCSVAYPQDAGSSWRLGWQQAVFALPPLLVASLSRQGSSKVLTAALEVLVTLTEQHPEFHTVLGAAGCLQPLLLVLLTSSTSSECRLQAACVLSALMDCPEVVEQLRQEAALRLLLRALGEQQSSLDVRLAILHILRRLATASQPCVEVLKAQGAVQVLVMLLQQPHTKEVKRAAAGLLQLLGKQVVARSSKLHKNSTSSSGMCERCSDRSSFESTCSVDNQMKNSSVYWPSLGREPIHQEMRGSECELSQHLQPSHLHTTPHYLHAH